MTLQTRKPGRLLAVLLAVILLLPLLSMKAPEAYAAGTVSLYHDRQYHYGNWSTGNLTVDDGAGTAFCVEPSKNTPPNGSYAYELLSEGSSLRKAMYYLVGGNGYDEVTSATLFSEYNYIDIYVTSHVMLSWMWDGCKWSGDADEGVGSDFKKLIESLYQEIMKLPDPPSGYRAFVIAGTGGYQTVVGSWPVQDVEVTFHKTSSMPLFTEGNSCYSLEGAVYRVYQSEADARADRNMSGEVAIRADGSSNAISLKPGNYYYKEVRAGKGYALDTEVHAFRVELSDGNHTIEVSDVPQHDPVELLILKKDAHRDEGEMTGDAKLSGAEFTVKYFPAEKLSGTAKYTWVFQTDADGRVLFAERYKKSGPALPTNSAGKAVLPLGVLTIGETKAPEGYLKNDEVFTVRITAQGSGEQVSTYQAPVVQEEVIRGGVAVEKYDRELDRPEAMGGASLEGITFTVYNASENDVLAGDKFFRPGEEITRLVTDARGKAQTEPDYLPYGTYTIVESGTNAGYLQSDQEKRTVRIRENGIIVRPEKDGNDLIFRNQVIRNDLSFHKVEDGTNHRMSMVAFLLTMEETGEEHVVVTNKNGYYSSVKSNSKDVNANDAVLDTYRNGKTISSDQLNPDAGLWFGRGQDNTESAPDDALGALPYGTYTLNELRCEANEGYELLEGITFYVEEDRAESPVISLGTLTNDRKRTPEIHTTALDKETNTHYAGVKKGMTVTDTIVYSGLIPGKTYTVTGIAMDRETGETLLDDHGNPVTSSTEYTPDLSDGKVALSFTFDGESLAGKCVVFTETVLLEDKEIAVHADLNDEAQTVYLLQIGTTARDAENEGHMSCADQDVTIIDEVRFEGLKTGDTYRIEGTLIDASTGKELLIFGEPVHASKDITPVSAKGAAELSFSFDGNGLAGSTIVVFEKILKEGEVIAVHEDLTDTEQTIRFPMLQTTAFDAGTDKETGKRIIRDTVSYSNVVPGEELLIAGSLMDKQEKNPVRDAGADVCGKAVFTPEKSEGTQEVTFAFDDTSYAGKELVVFEKLYFHRDDEKLLIASHEDINDAAQSVQLKKPAAAARAKVEKTVTYSKTVRTREPETGDRHGVAACMVIACLAGGGLFFTYRKRKA